MTEISQELARRMADFIETVAGDDGFRMGEARDILAAVPKPVSPDLQIVRDVIADLYEAGSDVDHLHRSSWAGFMRVGSYDGNLEVRAGIRIAAAVREDERLKHIPS